MTRRQAKRRKPAKKKRQWPKVSLPVLGIVKLLSAAVLILLTYEFSARLLDQPIQAITIDGPFQRVSALNIEEAISDQLGHGFLSANLKLIQTKIIDLPWIDSASVTRRWPGTLEIRVTEQIPAACWGEHGLLNTRGELFVEKARHVPAELPRLSGPEGQSALVAKRYLKLRDELIPMGMDLRRVHLDPRGAWEVTLQNGVEVRLGRRDVEERIELFVDVVANLVSSREADVDFVDMRYSNGFTIGWKEADTQSPDEEQQTELKEMMAGRQE